MHVDYTVQWLVRSLQCMPIHRCAAAPCNITTYIFEPAVCSTCPKLLAMWRKKLAIPTKCLTSWTFVCASISLMAVTFVLSSGASGCTWEGMHNITTTYQVLLLLWLLLLLLLEYMYVAASILVTLLLRYRHLWHCGHCDQSSISMNFRGGVHVPPVVLPR